MCLWVRTNKCYRRRRGCGKCSAQAGAGQFCSCTVPAFFPLPLPSRLAFPARRDGIFCPFPSTVCNSWTLSQMSVIFHSSGLPPFFLHKFLSTGVLAAHPSSSSFPSAFGFQGQYEAEEKALTEMLKTSPETVAPISPAQHHHPD